MKLYVQLVFNLVVAEDTVHHGMAIEMESTW